MFEKLKEKIKESRGELHNDFENCTYCGICQKKCIAKAITVNTAAKEWQHNDEKCSRCGQCTRKCPQSALTLVKKP